MCIYCKTTNYRKIYENHHGPILLDDLGRTYEIHHIDGDRTNNDPDNLMQVSMQEHYDIHLQQEDWGACLRIAAKMKLSRNELSSAARKQQLKRVANGTHPFLNKEWSKSWAANRVANGLCALSGSAINRRRVEEGTHPFLGGDVQRATNKNRIQAGTHNFLGSDGNKRRLENGTHPSQQTGTCVHCGKTFSISMLKRWHNDNCKHRYTFIR